MAQLTHHSEANKNYKWIALSCTTLGSLLMALSANMMMVALPVITRDLHTNIEHVVWTLMIYMLTMTVSVPSVGRIADMYGRKRLYVLGLIIFTTGSLFCGLSTTCNQLIAARFVQALGGSFIIANSTAILTDVFPGHQLGKALGFNMSVFSLGMIIGPAIGGLLTAINWRWIFLSNVPLGVLGAVWAVYHLREIAAPASKEKFDLAGTAAFTLGLSSILIVLTMGHIWGWLSVQSIFLCTTGLVLMAAFLVIESKVTYPMLDLTLFKTRFLAAAFSSNILNGLTQGSVIFLLTFYLQSIRGFPPVHAGILLIPLAASMMISSPISGSLSDRFGSRELSSLGFIVRAMGFLGLGYIGFNTSIAFIVLLTVVIGIGTGLYISPNSSAIMNAVKPERRGIAAGTRVMMNNAGMVGSVAISTAITGASSAGAMSDKSITSPAAMAGFLNGLQQSFFLFFLISLVGAFVSYARGQA